MKTKKDFPKDEELLPSSNKPKTAPSKSELSIRPKNSSNPLTENKQPFATEPYPPLEARKKGPTTRIIVKYDVGFNNSIYLRGDGADLSWEKGVMLKNVRFDEWVWETNTPFSKCEFKVLINDRQYELGENHPLHCGTSFEYTPSFHNL